MYLYYLFKIFCSNSVANNFCSELYYVGFYSSLHSQLDNTWLHAVVQGSTPDERTFEFSLAFRWFGSHVKPLAPRLSEKGQLGPNLTWVKPFLLYILKSTYNLVTGESCSQNIHLIATVFPSRSKHVESLKYRKSLLLLPYRTKTGKM